jgi:heat shock protein HslJ
MTRFLQTAVTIAALSLAAGGARAQTMNDVPFSCSDGRTITVDFSGDAARVTMTMSLDPRPAGSGFLYSGAAGELSGQGDEIRWTGSDSVTCRAVPGGAALVGGRWELLQVTPGGAGSAPVDAVDPARHSLTFLADGGLVLRADCNRGRGTWTAVPEGQGGTLEFGPVAQTMMACAEDQFPQMASALASAAAYRIEDGNLRIEVEGGAAYLFRPTAP